MSREMKQKKKLRSKIPKEFEETEEVEIVEVNDVEVNKGQKLEDFCET